MWVSVAFTTISVLGEAFLVRFLIALLRESKRFTARRPIPFKLEHKVRKVRYEENYDFAGDSAANGEVRELYAAFLRGEIHAKDSSRLITLAVLPGAGSAGRRSKPGDIAVFRQRWFFR